MLETVNFVFTEVQNNFCKEVGCLLIWDIIHFSTLDHKELVYLSYERIKHAVNLKIFLCARVSIITPLPNLSKYVKILFLASSCQNIFATRLPWFQSLKRGEGTGEEKKLSFDALKLEVLEGRTDAFNGWSNECLLLFVSRILHHYILQHFCKLYNWYFSISDWFSKCTPSCHYLWNE